MEDPQDISDITDMSTLMRRWEEDVANAMDPIDPTPILTRMAEVVELEIAQFNKVNPDPFDERHPSRVDPSGNLGQTLKIMFKKDIFMNKLVEEYLRDNYWTRHGNPNRDSTELNIAASRLIIDVMPGLETTAVFQTPEADNLVHRLFNWAEKAPDPLRTYAVGLLATAMEIQDTAAVFRDQNTRFVPMMLKALHELQREMLQALQTLRSNSKPSRPFAHLSHDRTPKKKCLRRSSTSSPRSRMPSPPPPSLPNPTSISIMSPPFVEPAPSEEKAPHRTNGVLQRYHNLDVEGEVGPSVSDCSNSSWAEMESFVIANFCIHPLTAAAKQVLILRYLTPMGEYQEFLSHIFENNALSLIINYINIRETKETRLGFEALKYLAALLCHKKVSLEFINIGGLQRLLEVPRPSMAATGVSICLYYLAYCEDAMEKICLSPRYVVEELVTYALWLLECSHNSGRCHATMFFGLSFQFRIILDEFDKQDGLRKMFNVISTLPIVSSDERPLLNDDEECSYRQMVRHVTVALKRYYEAHLTLKLEYQMGVRNSNLPHYKTQRLTPEEVQQQIEKLMELMPLYASWRCVDNFHTLGGISLLLLIIALAYEWNFSGRADTVQSALAVLSICSVRSSVQLTFCDRVKLPDNTMSVGMNIILGCCEGEVVPDPEIQKTALQLLINCVCAPVNRVGPAINSMDTSQGRRRLRSCEELTQKVWGCARENNGIIVLLMLMTVKTPITDADALRALSCRALAGLARCEKVRQIVSKLPVLTNGNMQVALKDPILHEKRAEHVQFRKHYLKLIEQITGDGKNSVHPHPLHSQDLSLTSIHRAQVVAQTQITYSKSQLYQLMHRQLTMDGLHDSAAALLKETEITLAKPMQPLAASVSNRSVSRSSAKSNLSPRAACSSAAAPTSPIKINLIRKEKSLPALTSSPRSLQKPTDWDSSGACGTVSLPKPLPLPTNPLQYADRMSLHTVMIEYLANQHALCKTPMVACPEFDLFVPHKCPEPKSRSAAPTNFVMRHLKRQSGFRIPSSLDIRLAHSRFCPERTIRINPDETSFSCCEFQPNVNRLAVGTFNGDLKLYNAHTGSEEAVYQCHDSYMTNMAWNRSGTLLLTSSTWGRQLSALWKVDGIFDLGWPLEEEFAEFSKTTQDKILGTNQRTATVYDVETGQATLKLVPVLSNSYTKNRATFSHTDELILTDGVLFDVRSATEIHKFDKLNSVLSGVFHPNGLEILSNTEIWDLRTFHLLRTVVALEHQYIRFNPAGSIIYTFSYENENDDEVTYDTSFKTLDSRDYSSIATIDTKKEIYHLTTNGQGTQIAVVENQGEHRSVHESTVKIYDVGRRRDQEDEVADEDDDDMTDDSGSNSDEIIQEGNALAELVADALRNANAEGGDDDDDTEMAPLESDDDDMDFNVDNSSDDDFVIGGDDEDEEDDDDDDNDDESGDADD